MESLAIAALENIIGTKVKLCGLYYDLEYPF